MSTLAHGHIDAEFHEGLQRQCFLLQVDDVTHRAQFFPRPLCLHSENRMHWAEARGQGEIVALTLNRTSCASAPFMLAWIRLEEGVRILARVDGAPESLAHGQPVTLSWQLEGDRYIPIFKSVPTKRNPR